MSSCASDDRKISTASTITHSPPASPKSPRHSAAIHPSQKTASRTLLEAPPRQPYRRLGEGSSASIDSGVEHMSLQEATSLTKPSVPPFLNTPWDHPLHWTMPSPAILADVFPPPLASAILAAHPERNTRCFCSIVLTIAQALLQPPNCKNLLRDTPTSLADCLTTLPHIFQPKALKVFTLECERLASLYGPTQLEHRIVTRTFAEHVSEFIEQLPLMGVAAYRSAAHQLDVEVRAQTLAQARVQTGNQTEPANTRDTARKHVSATLHRVWNRIGYKASTTTQCNDQAPPLVPAPATYIPRRSRRWRSCWGLGDGDGDGDVDGDGQGRAARLPGPGRKRMVLDEVGPWALAHVFLRWRGCLRLC